MKLGRVSKDFGVSNGDHTSVNPEFVADGQTQWTCWEIWFPVLFFPSNAFMALARSLHMFNRSKKMNSDSCKAVCTWIASKPLVTIHSPGDPMAQLVWRWSCQRWQTAGGGSNPCWSTRESQVRPAERQRAPTTKNGNNTQSCEHSHKHKTQKRTSKQTKHTEPQTKPEANQKTRRSGIATSSEKRDAR